MKAAQPAIYKPLKSGERCMDIAGANMANGSNVLLWDCHDGDNQQWRYEPLTGLIIARRIPDIALITGAWPMMAVKSQSGAARIPTTCALTGMATHSVTAMPAILP